MLRLAEMTAAIAAAAAVLLVAAPASAANVTLKAAANAAGVVPPTTAAGTCTMTATYGTVGKRLVGNVSCTGLTGDPTAVTINGPAAATENGPVMITLTAANGRAPINVLVSDDQWAVLNAEKAYVVVSTAANAGGEVRGLVDKQ